MKNYWMDEFSTVGLGMHKTHPGEAQMVQITKETLALRNCGKIASLSTLCHCKYSMKEYTMRIHLL